MERHVVKLSQAKLDKLLKKSEKEKFNYLKNHKHDLKEIEKSIEFIYKFMGVYKPVPVIILDSPMKCLEAIYSYDDLGEKLNDRFDYKFCHEIYIPIMAHFHPESESDILPFISPDIKETFESQYNHKLRALVKPGIKYEYPTTSYYHGVKYINSRIIINALPIKRRETINHFCEFYDFFKNCPVTYLFENVAFVSSPLKAK